LKKEINIKWIYLISIVYIVLNSILIANEFYWFSVLPALILVLLLYLFSLDKLIFLIAFLTPLAVNIRDFDLGFGISLPTEPLMAGVLLIFIIKLFYKNSIDIKLLKHPVTIAILINLIWIFITSITSEIPFVSLKFLIARLWFIVPFYFIAVSIFKNYKNIKIFPWVYVISLLGVIFYTISKHASYGFDSEIAHWIMSPFFNDHTAYGAVIAIFVPVFIGFVFNDEYSKTQKTISLAVSVILLIALYFSVSRAAWLSVVFAFGVYIIVLLKIKFSWIFSFLIIVIGLFFTFQNDIVNKMSRNKQDSSADLVEHVQSMSNITSDASNLERMNRWMAAIRMFKERPFWGWGPGTYQFIYAPFQTSKDKTIISTNAGNKGNAHSEYIGPMAESGVFGMLTFLSIVVCIVITALRVYKNATDKRVRYLSLLFMLGLFTYFMHGMLNNFLDSDKASVPFWGFAAIIVALDLYHKNKKEIS